MSTQDDIAELANNLCKRMVEIESNYVSKSKYRELVDGEQDECPTGDTYNLLWNAILDEFHAIGVDMSGIIEAYHVESDRQKYEDRQVADAVSTNTFRGDDDQIFFYLDWEHLS